MPRIGEPAERHPEQGIEDREGGAIEKADIGVVQAQVALQVGREDGDDLPVDEIEDIDEEQYAERIPRIGRRLDRGTGRPVRPGRDPACFGPRSRHWPPSPSSNIPAPALARKART